MQKNSNTSLLTEVCAVQKNNESAMIKPSSPKNETPPKSNCTSQIKKVGEKNPNIVIKGCTHYSIIKPFTAEN